MMRLGSGSPGCGRTSSRPFDQRAENTPQWEVCGRNGAAASGPEPEAGLSITSLIGNLSLSSQAGGIAIGGPGARHTTSPIRGRNAQFRKGSRGCRPAGPASPQPSQTDPNRPRSRPDAWPILPSFPAARRTIMTTPSSAPAMTPTHQPGQAMFRSVLPEDIDWQPFPAFPPSVRLAVVVGHPSEPGPYV